MSLKKQPLGQLVSISKGKKHIPSDNGSYRYINIEDLHNPLHSIFTNDKGTVVNENDLIIAWDGANAGKVGVGFNGVIGSTLARLSLKTNNVEPRFLFWYLESQNDIIKSQRTGATIPHVNGNALKDIEIPFPPLATQKRIAEILDAADALRRKDQELLKKYDELAQAIFIDMFGDPVKNEKGWKFVTLKDYGEFKNGLNFNKQEEGLKLLYLGVGDFKAKYKIDDVTNLSSIDLNNIPNEDFLLKDGDLIFVRSNGNKDLVGRCVQVFPRNEKVTFSGFCIRYRLNSKLITSTYLAQLFRSSTFKAVVFNGGRGANINNINQGILSEIKIPLPTIELQRKFKIIQEQLEKQINTQALKSNKVESLFNTLIQKAFKGELA
jgi:type I restriction enzyme S subunit